MTRKSTAVSAPPTARSTPTRTTGGRVLDDVSGLGEPSSSLTDRSGKRSCAHGVGHPAASYEHETALRHKPRLPQGHWRVVRPTPASAPAGADLGRKSSARREMPRVGSPRCATRTRAPDGAPRAGGRVSRRDWVLSMWASGAGSPMGTSPFHTRADCATLGESGKRETVAAKTE